MKILIGNKYYFPKGGAERYLFNIMDILRKNSHSVVPFSVDFPGTIDTPYRKYFVSPPSEVGVQLHQFKLSPIGKLKGAFNALYSFEAKKKIRLAIRETKPDLCYLLNFSNYLSPSIIAGSKKEGVPVVLRLSDHYLLCANAVFFRPDKFRCLDCLYHKYYNGVRHKCVNNSLGPSIIRVLSMYFHDAIRIYKKVDGIVVTNPFMKKLLGDAGFDIKKVHYIPTPVAIDEYSPAKDKSKYVLFSGRIVKEKGVEVLIDAFARICNPHYTLLIAGDKQTDYAASLINYIKEKRIRNIEFLGHKKYQEMKALNENAALVVVPSLCVENAPNTITEALASGTPVIASKVPGTQRMFEDGKEGFFFEPGNVVDLASKLCIFINSGEEKLIISNNARKLAERKYAPDKHYERLMDFFTRVTNYK